MTDKPDLPPIEFEVKSNADLTREEVELTPEQQAVVARDTEARQLRMLEFQRRWLFGEKKA